MRRLIAPSLLLILAAVAGVVFAEHCPGCIERSRINQSCDWTGDAAFPIDSNNPAHRLHLVADAQLAEDLAIRRADAEFGRLSGYETPQPHGGLIDGGRVRNDCMGALVAAIETKHAVTAEQIAAARGQHSRLFDAAAALSFVPLFLVCAAAVSGRLSVRFSSEGRTVRRAALALASIFTAALGLQAGQLWLGVWEAVRVRNGHMSGFRTATRTAWPHDHAGVLLAAGVAVFWFAAMFRRQTRFRGASRSAAMLSCTMLAAMFADVFVAHAAGYALVAAAVLVSWLFVSGVERVPDAPAPQGVLLR